jgi:uncharacterized NAD(P)/FAD-binding protein YdhS
LVNLEDGSELWSQQLVLAIGNLPAPQPPRGLESIAADAGYVHDPWSQSVAFPEREGSVAIIGSGLTAIDQIMTLDAMNHRGAIVAISRHGAWPGKHISHATAAQVDIGPASPTSLARRLRQAIVRHEAAGGHWQSVIDGLRPQTPALWGALTETERKNFCRHLSSFWNRSRHRMPTIVAERLEKLMNSGQLSLRKARFLQAAAREGRLQLDLGAGQEPLLVDRVINCTGASVRVSESRQPMLSQALGSGLLAPGSVGLGLANDVGGQLLTANGFPSSGLYTLGPMRQGSLWESTAIPEIRVQASDLAGRLLAAV